LFCFNVSALLPDVSVGYNLRVLVAQKTAPWVQKCTHGAVLMLKLLATLSGSDA
jgi:hypothetical protein